MAWLRVAGVVVLAFGVACSGGGRVVPDAGVPDGGLPDAGLPDGVSPTSDAGRDAVADSPGGGSPGILRDYLGDPAFPDDFWQAASAGNGGVDVPTLARAAAQIAATRFTRSSSRAMVASSSSATAGTPVPIPSIPTRILARSFPPSGT